jgi:hypothetical protein
MMLNETKRKTEETNMTTTTQLYMEERNSTYLRKIDFKVLFPGIG